MPKQAFYKLSKEKQQRILEAAADEFIKYKDQYEKSSVKRIAEAADIAIGSIYKYFYDKDDLFYCVYNANKDLSSDLSESKTFYEHSKKEMSLEARLTPVGEILSDIIDKNASLFHSLVFSNTDDADYMETLAAQLRKDEEKNLVRPDWNEDIACYMYSALEYIAYQYCLRNGLEFAKDEKILREMTDIFFFGLYRDGVKETLD